MEPAFQDIRPSSLIEHEDWVDAECPLEEVYQRLSRQEYDFLAVITGKKVLGICSRAEIGMLLGHRYGNALFAKKPVREHLLSTHIQVSENQSMSEVLQTAFERPKDRIYDDIIVTEEDGGFLGMISMQTLITLQNRYFFQTIDDLKRRTAELSQTKSRMEQDLTLARTLQRSILPAQYPRIPRKQITGGLTLSFSHFYRSAAYLGGDFFSILPMGSSKVGIFICDVVGHGVSAALITSMIRTMIDTIAPGTENPGRMLELMNIQLYNLLKNHTDNFFASAGYLFMDTRKEELSYADAGHPAPFLIIPETGEVGKLELPEGISGPPLGIIDTSQYGTFQRDLNEGERFFLFTDGAYEVFGEDGSMFGKERMAGLLRRHADRDAERMISEVIESITEFSSHKHLEDDVCMITVDTRRVSMEE